MVRPADNVKRETFSVRIRPEIIMELKHRAVDLKKPVSLLIEEAIEDLLKKLAKKSQK